MARVQNTLRPSWTQRMVKRALDHYDFRAGHQHVTLLKDLYREYVVAFELKEWPEWTGWDVIEFPSGEPTMAGIEKFGEMLNLAFPEARANRCSVHRNGTSIYAVGCCLGPLSFKRGKPRGRKTWTR